jgi:hypothetical protein
MTVSHDGTTMILRGRWLNRKVRWFSLDSTNHGSGYWPAAPLAGNALLVNRRVGTGKTGLERDVGPVHWRDLTCSPAANGREAYIVHEPCRRP